MAETLVAAGAVLSSQGSWDANNPQFLFTQLNAIKSKMMAEATRAAHDVATQFANDSGGKLGKIGKASQGEFSVVNRDRDHLTWRCNRSKRVRERQRNERRLQSPDISRNE